MPLITIYNGIHWDFKLKEALRLASDVNQKDKKCQNGKTRKLKSTRRGKKRCFLKQEKLNKMNNKSKLRKLH